MSKTPIIPNAGCSKMGRIRPGTQLAVREASDDEYRVQVERLEELNIKSSYIDPAEVACRWLVCFAADPSQVLHDWFSPVGGVTRELAEDEARIYAKRRGATVVSLEDSSEPKAEVSNPKPGTDHQGER